MARKILLLTMLTLLALLAVACDDKIKVSDQDIKQLDYKAMRVLMNDPKGLTVIVDPRIPRHYNEGHIEGAVNIPLAKLNTGEPALANALNIIVYGTTWTDYTSPAAAKKLMALGYKNVYDFRGGVGYWGDSGGRVIKAAPSATQHDAATK